MPSIITTFTKDGGIAGYSDPPPLLPLGTGQTGLGLIRKGTPGTDGELTITVQSCPTLATVRLYRNVLDDSLSTPDGLPLRLGWRADLNPYILNSGDTIRGVAGIGRAATVFPANAAFYAKSTFLVEQPLYRYNGFDGPLVVVSQSSPPDPIPLGVIDVDDLYISLESSGGPCVIQVTSQ